MKVCCVLIRMKSYNIPKKKKKKSTLNYPNSAVIGFFFKEIKERVRNSCGKRTIGVRATEGLLYSVIGSKITVFHFFIFI